MFDKDGKLIISTLSENMLEYQEAYKSTFGLVDISPASALGSDLAITAEMKKKSNEFIQYAFIQNSPYEAIDEGLDNLCFLRGIKRKRNEHSIALVKFTGADGIVIPKGSTIINSATDEEFLTNEGGVISGGVFSVFATSLNAGRIVCDAGTLNQTDIEGLSVTNDNNGILGFLIESNTLLRKRLFAFTNSLNIDEELELRLLNLSDVKYVNIISNPELETDENGIPAKKTAVVVLGGDSKEIAKTIFTTYSAEKGTFGTSSEVIASEINQKEYNINFLRPEAVSLSLEVTITINSSFNIDDIGVIKESILSYVADKFTISDDVLIDSLFIPVRQDYNDNNSSFRGITSVSFSLNGGSENIPIAYNQFSVLSSGNLIIVTV